MTTGKLFIIVWIIILSASNSFSQNLTFGLANLGTRYTISDNEQYDHGQRNFLTPGIEFQIAYPFNEKWTITSGINYQSLFFKTRVIKDETPGHINSAMLRDFSIPFLVGLNFNSKESIDYRITAGFYYAIPLSAMYTENDKIYGGGGYTASSITYWISQEYCYSYLGGGVHKMISSQWDVYAEPFACFQFNENDVSQRVRGRFWFGIKIGINYSVKIKKDEDDNKN